jgi:hypothetical protein
MQAFPLRLSAQADPFPGSFEWHGSEPCGGRIEVGLILPPVLPYVQKLLRAGCYARTSLADLLRDYVCAFEFSAGAAGEWFALEDAFNVSAAHRAGFNADRLDVALV